MAGELICWEALDADDPAVEQARQLYEATQHRDEQIPWEWIGGALDRRRAWRPGRWGTHLLLAALRTSKKKHGPVIGFANGLHLPEYGGYLPYIGVDAAARGRGIGTRLVEAATLAMQFDACCEGGALPFVVWESRPPAADDPAAIEAWRARLGLWRRAGAYWVSGLTFHAVNYKRRQAPPVSLALFLRPVARPAESFDAEALRDVAAGLLREVYRRGPGDEHYERTLPPGCRPALRPVEEALGLTSLFIEHSA